MPQILSPRQLSLSTGIAFFACASFGQATQSETFDVASVKPSPPPRPGGRSGGGPPRGGPGTADPSQITWSGATLKSLLMTAYDVKEYQVSGPAWLGTERYEIIAKVPAGATVEQVRVMWQNLLAERFGVVLHHDSKEFQVDELVVAKGGSKLKETTLDPNAPAPPLGAPGIKSGQPVGPGIVMDAMNGPNGPIGHMAGKAETVAQLATVLGNQLNRPVFDKTGLTGKYDFTIEFTPDLKGAPAAAGASDPGSNLPSAVEQQLGLRLVSGKAKLDMVVVDKAERVPTEN